MNKSEGKGRRGSFIGWFRGGIKRLYSMEKRLRVRETKSG